MNDFHTCKILLVTFVISLQVIFELRASGNQATRTKEVGKDVDTPQPQFQQQCYDDLKELAKAKGNNQM